MALIFNGDHITEKKEIPYTIVKTLLHQQQLKIRDARMSEKFDEISVSA